MVTLYGYKINIKSLPQTLFACSTTVDNYNWKNNNKKNTIEFSIFKSKANTMIINNEKYINEGTFFSCIIGSEDVRGFCDSGVQMEITTLAVQFDEIGVTPCELSIDETFSNSYFLLPLISDDPSLTQEVLRLINKYINLNVSDTSYDSALCTSVWFNILYHIDKFTRELLSKPKRNSDNYYVKKLDYIINNRFNENISLTKIAEDFGVSMSYLSSTYSQATGQSFKEAIFSVRMKKAKELVTTTSLSYSDIAASVGLCDETYLKKCFKKFFGVSISNFKKINKGLTLYHEKPTRN